MCELRGVESEYAAEELNEEVRLHRISHPAIPADQEHVRLVLSYTDCPCPRWSHHWPLFTLSQQDTSSTTLHISASSSDSDFHPPTPQPFHFSLEELPVLAASSSVFSPPVTTSFDFEAAAAGEMERARERVRNLRASLGLDHQTLALLVRTEAQMAAIRALHDEDQPAVEQADLIHRRLAHPGAEGENEGALEAPFRSLVANLLNTLP